MATISHSTTEHNTVTSKEVDTSDLWVNHRCAITGRVLSPWIVHVFQGKPAHQTTSDNATESIDAATASSSALPLTASAAATPLPFDAPTSKAGHESHDLRALSPEQAAAYANEYGKVEQALEIESSLRRLRYRDAQGLTRSICESVTFHQVSIVTVSLVIAKLQAEQSELDARRVSAVASSSPGLAQLIPQLVVMNLCDGTEEDGYPGVTIARALAQTMDSNTNIHMIDPPISADSSLSSPPAAAPFRRGLCHTGADPLFFSTTTEKTVMKTCFHDGRVSTSRFVDLTTIDLDTPVNEQSIQPGSVHAELYAQLIPSSSASLIASAAHDASSSAAAVPPSLSYPLIIKPTSSYSSCGLSNSSVVHNPLDALIQAQAIKRELGPVLAEEFIKGREFSMLIVGDWDGDKRQKHNQREQQIQDDTAAASIAAASDSALVAPAPSSTSLSHLRCYTAAERVFTASLPPEQQFLTFEQNYPTQFTQCHTWWSALDVLHNPHHAQDQQRLDALAKQAYTACKGRSYGRIDIRQDSASGEFFCLEVNSLPGLSGELDSSVGAILSHATPPTPFAHFLYAILFLAAEGTLDA